jgi:translation initiation factor 2B subunit (eIF-2B alpha/beta/delta family)
LIADAQAIVMPSADLLLDPGVVERVGTVDIAQCARRSAREEVTVA